MKAKLVFSSCFSSNFLSSNYYCTSTYLVFVLVYTDCSVYACSRTLLENEVSYYTMLVFAFDSFFVLGFVCGEVSTLLSSLQSCCIIILVLQYQVPRHVFFLRVFLDSSTSNRAFLLRRPAWHSALLYFGHTHKNLEEGAVYESELSESFVGQIDHVIILPSSFTINTVLIVLRRQKHVLVLDF